MNAVIEEMEQSAPEIERKGVDCLAPVYNRLTDQIFVDGDGSYVVDQDGNRYLDMTSGIAVLALGHKSAVVEDALKEAASELLHTSNLFLTEPPVALAKELVRLSFADRVFFANSGTEANEAAIKFARMATSSKKQRIVYFDRSFHGRTYGSLSATDRLNATDVFGPLPGEFCRATWNDTTGLTTIDDSTTAVIVEPVQGEGGVRPADTEWMRQLRKRCDDVGALVIFDEVQCGVGRTGTLWAYEQMGVTPDIMTLAKQLAGGLPIGAVLMTEKIAQALEYGCHGSTFGGGPAVTHVALAVLRHVADPVLLSEVERKGKLLMDRLRAIDSPVIRGVRGLGLIVGVQVSVSPKKLLKAALRENLLLTAAGDDVVRFLPPLTVSDDEIDEAVRRFEKVISGVVDKA